MSLMGLITEQTVNRGVSKRFARGWIGIDIGTHAIKIAQIERTADKYRITAQWILSGQGNTDLNGEQGLEKELCHRLSAIKKLRRLFTGRSCASVLPMSLVDVRSFEIPNGDANEQYQMIAEELAADLEQERSEFTFGYWKTTDQPGQNGNLDQISVIAVPRKIATAVASGLLKVGMECQMLNGMPCAIARAVEMAGNIDPELATLAVDVGYSSPTLVLVHQGRPVFSRVLRGGSLQSLMQPLQQELLLSAEECQQLLFRFGIPIPGQATNVAAQKTLQLIASPLQELVSEIELTMHYIQQQFPALKPSEMQLLGGGAQIKNLSEYLQHKLQVPTKFWSLEENPSDSSTAMYGVAAALSSLAWENETCT